MATASSQALAFRDVMYTFEHPAWRRLFYPISLVSICCAKGIEAYPDAAWRPRPLEPPVTTATLPSREKSEEKLSRCASDIFN